MLRIAGFVVGFFVGLYDRFMDWWSPVDWGNHGILVNRGDHFSPMTDDEMWDMLDSTDQAEEAWWEDQFVQASRRYGMGVFAEN